MAHQFGMMRQPSGLTRQAKETPIPDRVHVQGIPRLFWALMASCELSLLAPIMHDLIYRSGGRVILPHGEVTPAGKIFERKEADDLFPELMTRATGC